ncbi:YetF domain-containing protein [Neisseria sp. P0006.S006]
MITDGQVDPDILEIIKRDEEWLQQELDHLHLEASQVYIGEYIDGKLVAHRYPS